MKSLDPRGYESTTHAYAIEHWASMAGTGVDMIRHERVNLTVRNKKVGRSIQLMFPVSDAPVVGELISDVYLERAGFLRMEVTPDDLREEDVIEGLGPILEIEEIPGMTFDMLKVMVQTIPKPDGDGMTRGTASVLFSQVDGEWPSLVGITRPVEVGANESS